MNKLSVYKSINFFYRASKTGLIDSSAETQKALKDEVEKINKQFGSSSSAEFPSFKFAGIQFRKTYWSYWPFLKLVNGIWKRF